MATDLSLLKIEDPDGNIRVFFRFQNHILQVIINLDNQKTTISVFERPFLLFFLSFGRYLFQVNL